MEFQLAHAIEILKRTPATLNSLLRDLPEPWLVQNEGPETWSPYDVIGHLIHGEETDWIPRARIILVEGGPRILPPYPPSLSQSAERTLRRRGIRCGVSGVERRSQISIAIASGSSSSEMN